MQTSPTLTPHSDEHFKELRLLLEDVCCHLVRFHHARQAGLPPERIRIDEEVDLGIPSAFADLRVQIPGAKPYFIEVKWGHSGDRVLSNMLRKYSRKLPATQKASKVVLVVDRLRIRDDWPRVKAKLRAQLRPGLKLEVWDEKHLATLIRKYFGLRTIVFTQRDLFTLRQALDRAQGVYAFGNNYANDPLHSSLLWHFGFLNLRELCGSQRLVPQHVLSPGRYEGVVVVFADLSGFSSYVRDTPDERVMRSVLTTFYSKARYQVHSAGGMLYQFWGDGVIGLFGLPDQQPGYEQKALECAQALLDVGKSISYKWQRQIDRLQKSGGCHIGMAKGDLSIVALDPFSRSQLGAVADAINTAARLTGEAEPGEIVVSNSFYRDLPVASQTRFRQTKPVEARNIGRLWVWRLG